MTAPRLTPAVDDAWQPFQVAYGGILYPGEVVFTRQWDARLGRALEEECYFRIVFLRSAQDVPIASLEDGRIAVCAVGQRASLERQRLERELLSVREARASYSTRTARDTVALRRALESQEQEVEAHLLAQDALRFRNGRLLCKTDLGLSPVDALSSMEPGDWAAAIASALLAHAYPVPLVYTSLVVTPLRPEDAGRVWLALSASSGAEREPLRELGPTLGLSDPDRPDVFSPLRCRAFDVIRLALAERQTLPWAEVRRRLAHDLGLTGPYATLCLLAFVCHSRPEVELLLAPGHTLRLRRRAHLLGDRLTRELAPLLDWRVDLSRDVSALVRPRQVTWNGVLPYAALLGSDFVPVAPEAGPGPQAQRLMATLAELAQDIRLAEGFLRLLVEAVPSLPQGRVAERLARLRPVANASDTRSFLARAREQFGSTDEMERDIESLQRILRLRPHLQELVEMRGYVDGAAAEMGFPDLAMEREVLLARVALDTFLDGGQTWEAVAAAFGQFRTRYSRAYAQFHASYHETAAGLRTRLEQARSQAAALSHLNTLTELGTPVGEGLAERVGELVERLAPCGLSHQKLPLELAPRCPRCQLPLGAQPPTREAEEALAELGAAVSEQMGRLSQVLVQRILYGHSDRRLEDLLRIVQASDLSALSNTLDSELVEFLRTFLEGR
ncbi:MAG: hypothetical protein Q8O40_09550 [Chloroflexota bacterium]|nr:hypothetical protein [Chloroflexota bacterium]